MKSTPRSHALVGGAKQRKNILRTSILAACGVAAFLAPRLSFADILSQYTFGPDGSTPGVLTPTTAGANVSPTSITADPGLGFTVWLL